MTTNGIPEAALALPEHPYWPNDLFVPDQAYLNQLAADYLRTGAEADSERFLYGNAPLVIFDEILGGDLGGDGLGSRLWVLHLSGWFGGRWLRGEINAAQPDAPIQAVNNQLTEEAFTDTVARASDAIDKAYGDPAVAANYANEVLWPTAPLEGGEAEGGMVDNFGYNQGYLDEILMSPPEGVTTSPEFLIECDGPLTCTYATPRLESLPVLTKESAASLTPLRDRILAIQDPAIERGRGVWSGGLSVQGFDQVAYDQLLDVSSSFLETVQATALAAVIGATGESPERARAAGVGQAAQIVWLNGYFGGLLDGMEPFEVPSFE